MRSVKQSGCPAREDLIAFAEGDLAESESETVADHVSQCESCERLLCDSTLSASSLLLQLRMAATLEPVTNEPECIQMVAAASRWSLVSATECGAQPATREFNFSLATQIQVDNSPLERGLSGRLIGRYRLKSLLGEGGFGEVFLAIDVDLDRPVALKFPKNNRPPERELDEASWREARIAARLRHPGIVTIYEVAREPVPFIAMEYVEGWTLQELLSRPLAPETAVDYLVQAAQGVHFAHKRGLVHRDLKPANLLVSNDGRLKIADFGLALFEEELRSGTGEVAGTLPYMAPEQVRGALEQIDARCDIWSLGVIFYEMLTGRLPFHGSRPEILDRILRQAPKPPRQISDAIPPELERICLRCLEKDVKFRYSTANELAHDLTQWQRSRGGKSERSHIELVAAIGLAVIALVVVAGWSMFRSTPDQKSDLPTEAALAGNGKPLETVALHDVWYDLLRQAPQELSVFNAPVADRWYYVPERFEVRGDAGATSLLTLGETYSKRFRVKVDVTKQGAAGRFGVFFGHRSLGAANGKRQWEYQTVSVQCSAGQEYRLLRELMLIEEVSPGVMAYNGRGVVGVPVAAQLVHDVCLDLEFSAASESRVRLSKVTWGGQEARRLTDPSTTQQFNSADCVGQFGLVNNSGSAAFREAKWINYQKEASQ